MVRHVSASTVDISLEYSLVRAADISTNVLEIFNMIKIIL
jgi:hypothetical protein